MSRAPAVWLAASVALTAIGPAFGIVDDLWGWWPLPVVSASVGLWLIVRDPEAGYRKAAKWALATIGGVLLLAATASIAFVIWFSGFEF